MVPPTSGRVRFAGEDITGLPAHAICQRGLSRTFQLTSLFPEMSARENTMLAAQARHARRWQPFGGAASLRARAAPATRRWSSSASTHVADRQAGLLSHGDQRLLEVAMAMAQEPQSAAARRADAGPLGGGDGAGCRDAGAVPGQARVTVLLVEHDMEVVFRLAHKITVLHRGAVIADGTPAAVKANARVQEAYLGGMT